LGLADSRRVIVFDKRGTGLSDRHVASVSLDAHVEDLEAVVEHYGLDQFDLYGQSEGGPMAIRYAANHPAQVRRLILLGTYARGDHLPPDVHDALLRLVRAEWGLASEALANMFMPGSTGEEAAAWTAGMRRGADAEDAAALWASMRDTDVTADLPRIACPTLVIHVEGDRVVPFAAGRALAAGIRGARLVSIPGNSHMIRGDELQPFLDAFIRFLDDSSLGRADPQLSSSRFRTILFTDVVSSTPLLTQLRDAKMREVMRDHDAVMEAAVTSHSGRVVKTIGDAFMAEFAVPSAAVEAAIEAQRAIRERFVDSDVPVRIRIGINAGEPIEEDGDLHGASVVIAKRLESAADTNGILVSDVVKQMVTGKDFDFEDRGPVELKGFDESVRAWAVRWE
jgi:class 3 adenylate cyclase/pimeloyl-ACP methyl ester carboxylesterase